MTERQQETQVEHNDLENPRRDDNDNNAQAETDSIKSNPSSLGEISHPLDDDEDSCQPHQYSKNIKQRQRTLHALKVGLGVFLTSLLVLIDALDKAFVGNGVWAVITVIIVTLPTPGGTTQKIINRTTGTIVGATLALLVGLIASKLSEALYPAGHIFLATANFLGASAGTLLSTRGGGGQWSYAFLLGTVTYVFITLSVFRDGVSVAFFRTFMIALGGIIGFLVSWLPPHVRASDVARAYLADALLDTGACAELVVHNFLTGRHLNPIHEIYSGETDDPFHQLSKTIQISREPLEAAISACRYEAAGKLGKTFKSSGLSVRLSLRTLLSADMLLRQEYYPLDQTNAQEQRLAIALRNVVSSIRTEFTKKVVDLNCALPKIPKYLESCAELSLSDALDELATALYEYVLLHQSTTSATTAEASANVVDVIHKFACHVSFARLIYDSGRYILDVSSTVVLPQGTRGLIPTTSMELLAI